MRRGNSATAPAFADDETTPRLQQNARGPLISSPRGLGRFWSRFRCSVLLRALGTPRGVFCSGGKSLAPFLRAPGRRRSSSSEAKEEGFFRPSFPLSLARSLNLRPSLRVPSLPFPSLPPKQKNEKKKPKTLATRSSTPSLPSASRSSAPSTTTSRTRSTRSSRTRRPAGSPPTSCPTRARPTSSTRSASCASAPTSSPTTTSSCSSAT